MSRRGASSANNPFNIFAPRPFEMARDGERRPWDNKRYPGFKYRRELKSTDRSPSRAQPNRAQPSRAPTATDKAAATMAEAQKCAEQPRHLLEEAQEEYERCRASAEPIEGAQSSSASASTLRATAKNRPRLPPGAPPQHLVEQTEAAEFPEIAEFVKATKAAERAQVASNT